MPSIKITDLSTYKNSTWTKEVLFDPYRTDLVLAVDFDLSADIAATPNVRISICFEVIEFRTNKVIFYHIHDWDIPLNWQSVYSILGPLAPYDDMGLRWGASDIFGVRASIESLQIIGYDLKPFACLAVSDIYWFRLEHIIRLAEPQANDD
jgi:hypothetical protein